MTHGGTLGPAPTFGWLAGADAAHRAAAERADESSTAGPPESAGSR